MKATSPSLANSEGWMVRGPRSIHREAPYIAVPDVGCAAINMPSAETASKGTEIAFHAPGRIRLTTAAAAIPATAYRTWRWKYQKAFPS